MAQRVEEVGPADLVLFSWDTEGSGPVEIAPAAEPGPELELLSKMEREVFAYVVQGKTNGEIAELRGVSARTVANQVASILRKLDARSRLEIMSRFGGT